MIIPILALKAKYEEMSELFITDINATPVTLYYAPQAVLTTVDVTNDRPTIFDEYGGRVPIENLPDRQNESGNDLAEVPTNETILARVYWDPKQDARDVRVKDAVGICKVITYTTDVSKLTNATEALINNKKVKLLFSPTPYGMFGEKQYSCSYWQQI